MKLDWKDAKFYSIADSPCGRWSFLLTHHYDARMPNGWEASIESDDEHSGRVVAGDSERINMTRDAAKRKCEAWVDTQDKPTWLETADRLAACASWRGWSMVVRQSADGQGRFVSEASKPPSVLDKYDLSFDAAKTTAESLVRERTA